MTRSNQKGIAPIFIVGIVALLIVVAVGSVLTGVIKIPGLTPAEDRSNPVPISPNRLFIKSDVNPGKTVLIDEVELLEDGYVVVYKDTGKQGAELGRSELLTKGSHNSVTVSLKSAVTDGDVVLVKLVNKSSSQVNDVNENPIEVQKSVGMPHGHYDMSEY